MPTVLIHEEVAYNIAKKYQEHDNKDFYLGALAPDSVNLNGFAPKEVRWTSHLRKENLDEWLEKVKEFYNENKNKYNKYFLLGYVLHIITDIVHDKYFYQNIRNIIKEDMISWKDLCLKEYQKDIIPNKYITKSHIIELTKKTEEIFKTFII